MDQVPYLSNSDFILGCLILITALAIWAIISPHNAKHVRLVAPLHPAKLGDADGSTCTTFVEQHCSSLKDGFKPSWWLPNGHAQTIYSAMADFSNDDHVTYQRHLLRLPDGGTIGVDVYPPLSVQLPSDAPIIIVNHGLTGGSHESYVRNIVRHVAKTWDQGGLGGRAAVVNFRGCAETPLTSPHLYSSGTTLDTHTATLYLSHLFPNAPFFGIGFSLGAAVMTRYLGELGQRCRLKAATVLCAPLELKQMSAQLDARHFFPKLYSYTMARKMIRSLLPHLLPNTPLSSPGSALHPHVPALLSMAGRYRWTLRASHVTALVAAKVGGSSDHFPFEGLPQFLEWACPGAWLGSIRRPTLAISALDDPIVSGACLPYSSVQASSHLVLAAVPNGGHLGWFEGPFHGSNKHQRWHVRPVLEFLRAAMKLPQPELEPVCVKVVDGWNWVGEVGWKVVDEQPEQSWKCA